MATNVSSTPIPLESLEAALREHASVEDCVLIRRGGTILGQLDVDSDVPAGFTPEHHEAVRAVADALAVLL